MNSEVVTFATEDKHAKAKAWVADKSGVEEWSRGWLVVDGTHINLAWKPALNACKHYSYKGDYTFNIALVFLPHSLCIVKLVVGHPGSSHDARCHGPGCSRSRRVMGSYGRSTGIEDLVDTSREHGRSAVSMETTDSYGFTCKGEPSHMRGGPGTATRRTKLKEQAQPRGGPSSRSRHSHEEDQAQGACRWS
ncbi:hypothetical protein NDA14_002804 [Ustilago hordei]|nr:hypothetical protein NDA14_002804 [Ustilago hordei]